MNNLYRYKLLFILSLTCINVTPTLTNYALSSVGRGDNRLVLAAADASDLIAQSNTYEYFIESGDSAFTKQNYVQAWQNYQRAVQQRPNDAQAAEKLAEAEGYAFDQLMQEGYAAADAREYQKAMQKFEQALAIEPDSSYAQRAVKNVKQYILNQSTQTAVNEPEESFNWLWLPAVALVLVGIGVGVWLWQRKSHSSTEEDQDELYPESEFKPEPPVKLEPLPQTPPLNHRINGANDHYSESIDHSQSIYHVPTNDSQINQSSLTTNSSLSKVDIVVELVKELDDLDPKVRRKAIWELAQRSDSRALKPLVSLMIEADSQERSLILEAVSQIASRTLKPVNEALQISLEDENSQVRKNAIRDLTKVYELMSQVTKRLTHAVEDPDIEVQETARWALNQLNQMPNITELNTLIQPSQSVQDQQHDH